MKQHHPQRFTLGRVVAARSRPRMIPVVRRVSITVDLESISAVFTARSAMVAH